MFRKSKIIITLGLLTALMPLLGFSGGTRDTIIIVFSLTISIIGFIYLIEERKLMKRKSSTENLDNQEAFIDNSHQFTKDNTNDKSEIKDDDDTNIHVEIKDGKDKNNVSIKLNVKGE